MNNFSFKRFWLLCRKIFVENKRIIIYAMLAQVAWTAFLHFNFRIGNVIDGVVYIVSMFITGIIFANYLTSSHFGQKTHTIEFMLVPATHLEKFIVFLLYGVILFFCFHFIVFKITEGIYLNIQLSKFPSPELVKLTRIYEPVPTEKLILPSGIFLCITLLAMWGGVFFQKFSFIKTAALGIVCTVGLTYFWYYLVSFFSTEYYKLSNDDIVSTNSTLVWYIGIAGTFVGLLFAFYYSLKEKQT